MRTFDIPGVEHRPHTLTDTPNAGFLHAVLGVGTRVHHVSRTSIATVARSDEQRAPYHDDSDAAYPVPTVTPLLRAAHDAFGHHVPLALAPEVLWYAIVHEVAVYVKADPKPHAKWFTATPDERRKIEVRDDSLVYGGERNDWNRAIERFRGALGEHIPTASHALFLPRFTTATPETETAVLVAFMDAASPYFRYGMTTMCGIPTIRLEGEPADWDLLAQSTAALAEMFPGLRSYIADLMPILKELAAVARGGTINADFWTSLYSWKGDSGGPYVGGWITALFAHTRDWRGGRFVLKPEHDWRRTAVSFGGEQTNAFPSHVSTVPFNWDYLGREIPMGLAAGVLGTDATDGFLTPRLGFAVYEPER